MRLSLPLPPVVVLCLLPLSAQDTRPPLPFPGLLKQSEREAGNPPATYAAMLELDAQYQASPVFAAIYPEVRLNYEEFLGVPDAGLRAMSLPALRSTPSAGEQAIPDGYAPVEAVTAIARAAAGTRLVIFGEEHHLPQTRCLYEALLRRLWDLGYRWLAAEAFTPDVMEEGFRVPDYHAGYYTMDPVFASAVRTARVLGYRLVAYDTSERGPPGDGSFRDRTQAENLKRLVFDVDPGAKLLVIAGRGHAAEVPPADGWTPMASLLKEITGMDPFKLFAPTMSERSTREEEDPLYRYATAHELVKVPVVFVEGDSRWLGSGNCDAYVFWPRVKVVDGRPNWMGSVMGRKRTAIPAALKRGEELRLVQAFFDGEPGSAVPVDQVLLRAGEPVPALMLPPGVFWLRTLDAQAMVAGPVEVTVE